jgi:hypothetical protein
MAIGNDKEFKAALAGLPVAKQRQVASRFVQRVFDLSNDVRVKAALEVAGRPEISDAELTVVSSAANTARVESFTQCGKETDWAAQAGLFVAKAAVACVGAPSARQQPWPGTRPCRRAWRAPARPSPPAKVRKTAKPRSSTASSKPF